MAIRWYLMPMVTTNNRRHIKYMFNPFVNTEGLHVRFGATNYGLADVVVMWADVTAAEHTALTANADVRSIVAHANIDNQIGAGPVSTVRSNLEALNIPGLWVGATDTWRTVIRTTCALFQFAGRLHARFGVVMVPDGFTLATTWDELPQQAQTFLLDVATELEIDTSGATGGTTLRQIYKAFADAWGTKPIFISGIEL